MDAEKRGYGGGEITDSPYWKRSKVLDCKGSWFLQFLIVIDDNSHSQNIVFSLIEETFPSGNILFDESCPKSSSISTSSVQEAEAHWFIWDQNSAAEAFQLLHL